VIVVAVIIGVLIFALYFAFSGSCSFAEYGTSETQKGRYVLATVEMAGIYSRPLQRKLPVVVLDSYLGIVWRCQDLQDEKPIWIKTDLAKNSDKQASGKKYTIRIPTYTGYGVQIPAIVVDTEEGKTWTCSDISSVDTGWVEKDLKKEVKGEGYKY